MRYVLRNEFFGGLLYDRENKAYFHLDTLDADVLRSHNKARDCGLNYSNGV